jgi:hypothetical protein
MRRREFIRRSLRLALWSTSCHLITNFYLLSPLPSDQ